MRFALIVGFLALLAACQTPYQPLGPTGGFSETPLDDVTFRINAKGNGFTSREIIQDYALLRASELARQRGYPYFAVLNANDWEKLSSYTTPGSFQAYSYGGYGGATTYGTFTPPTTTTISKPRSEMIIRLLKNKEEGTGFVLDANVIYANLAPKYKTEPQSTPQVAIASAVDVPASAPSTNVYVNAEPREGDGKTSDIGIAPPANPAAMVPSTTSVALAWEGVSGAIPGSAIAAKTGDGGTLSLHLPRAEGRCNGSYSYDGAGAGIWTMACTNGDTASGTFTSQGEGKGASGQGTDNQGRRVEYTIAPTSAAAAKLSKEVSTPSVSGQQSASAAPKTFPIMYSKSGLWSVEVTEKYGCFLGQKNNIGQVFGIGATRSASDNDTALFAFIESEFWSFTKPSTDMTFWLGSETYKLEGKSPPDLTGALVAKLDRDIIGTLVSQDGDQELVLNEPRFAAWSLRGFRDSLNDWAVCNEQYIQGGGPHAVVPKAS